MTNARPHLDGKTSVRSAMTLDANLKLRTLSFAEWQAKVQSPEYRAIEKKLPQRK